MSQKEKGMMKQKFNDNQDDFFVTLSKNFDKIHQSMEQLTPIQTQSLSNLQQASFTYWKNVACSNISLLQVYANPEFVDSNIAKISKNFLDSITNEFINVIKLQSNFAKTYWDVTKKNVEDFNRNTETITAMSRKYATFYQHILKNTQK